jgi:DNA-directed RNA polymerase subunit H (RpoH/RPB5)
MDDLFDPVYTSPGFMTGEGCIVVKHMRPSPLSGSESISADDLKQFLAPGGQFQVSTQAIEQGKHRAIIITKVKLSSAFEDLIRSENQRGQFIIEHFLEKELGFNITKHALVPQHEKLSADQKKELLRRCAPSECVLRSFFFHILKASQSPGTSWQKAIFPESTKMIPSLVISACRKVTFFELSGPLKLPGGT